MDPLDLALLDAWNRLTPRIRADRLEDSNLESARRASRRSSATLNRPLRAWCLCLRAADSRLDTYAAVAPYAALRINAPHTLYIDAPTVRKLVAPITIPWPGLRLRVAARRLGRDPATIHSWVKRGVLQVTYEAPSIHSHRGGRKIPIVWTPSPLDPNADLARAPDPVWGSMWQHHHTRVPDDLTLIVNREMTYRYDPRRRKKDLGLARGWQFICPGLPLPPRVPLVSRCSERLPSADQPAPVPSSDPSPTHPITHSPTHPLWPQHPEDHPPITCGRPARRLYCPRPIIDLPHLLNDDPLSPWERVAESARPGEGASPLDASMPRRLDTPFFACSHCHQLTYTTLQADGWNAFIAHISRGLLYGHEVERPASTAFKRKLAYRPRTRRAPQRDRVLALLLQGLTKPQIAAALGRSKHTIDVHVQKIYKAHNVHSRAELCRELGVPPRPRPAGKVPESRRGRGSVGSPAPATPPVVPRRGGARLRGPRPAARLEVGGNGDRGLLITGERQMESSITFGDS